jgi:putative oxidoreductase
MDALDITLLLLRGWAGVIMVAHGLNHLRSQKGTTRWFEKIGFRFPRLNARLSTYGELAIGVGLIAGLLTPAAAAGLGATMLIAFWAIHRHAGFFVFHRPDEGYEYVVTVAMIALALAVLGPGEVSVDEVLGLEWTGWAGAWIYLGGLGAGVAQLVVFYRRPESEVT